MSETANLLQKCPDREVIQAYLLGTVVPEVAVKLETHFQSCTRCEQLSDSLTGYADAFLQDLRKTVRQAEQDSVHSMSDDTGKGGESASQEPHSKTVHSERIREYHLLEKLGEGGMGVVYRAEHTKLKKTVAVKVLPDSRLESGSMLARFEREMAVVGQLSHPRIVRATDAGEWQGQHYLVMEHVEGIDLSRLVKQHGPLSVTDACQLVQQTAEGLQHAHDNGLVHRDIKTGNLMLGKDGMVKILDLGLALLHESNADEAPLTAAYQVMGTPQYMAPEQWDSTHEVTDRVDVYALGCTLYFLLAGKTPYPSDEHTSMPRMMTAHTQAAVPSIRSVRPDVPEQLASFLPRMLAKQADHRPSCAEVVDTLRPFGGDAELTSLASLGASNVPDPDGTSLRASTATPQMERAIPTATMERPVKPTSSGSRSRLGWLLGGISLLVLIGCVVWFLRPSEDPLYFVVDLKGDNIETIAQGTTLIVRDKKTKQEYKLSLTTMQNKMPLPPGDYLIQVEDGTGLKVDTKEFRLTRGMSEVRVTLRPMPQKPAIGRPNGEHLAPLSPSSIVSRPTKIPNAKTLEGWDIRPKGTLSVPQYPDHLFLEPKGNKPTLIPFMHSRSPDGTQHLAPAVSPRSAIDVSVVGEREPYRTLRQTTQWPNRVADLEYSPDGKYIACVSSHQIGIYDIVTLKLITRYQFHTQPYWSVNQVSWLPDCRGLIIQSTHQYSNVEYFDLELGRVRRSYRIPLARGEILASPDGDHVAILSSNGLAVWNRLTGKEVVEPIPGVEWVDQHYSHGLSWSPDGKQLAVRGKKNSVLVYDTTTWKESATCQGHAKQVQSVLFSPDGTKLLSNSEDGTIRVWSPANGEHLGTLVRLKDQWVEISPDGNYRGFLDVEDELVIVVEERDGTKKEYHPYEFSKKYGWKNDPNKVDFLPKKNWGRPTPLVQPETPKFPPSDIGDNPAALAESPADLAGLKEWNLEAIGTKQIGLNGQFTVDNAGVVRETPYPSSPDGKYYIVGGKGVFEVGKEEPLLELNVGAAAFSPDGTRLACNDRLLRVYNTKTWKLEQTYDLTRGQAYVWLPDNSGLLVGHALGGSSSGRIEYFDFQQRKILAAARGNPTVDFRSMCSMSPDGRLAAIIKEDGTHLWDFRNDATVQILKETQTYHFSRSRLYGVDAYGVFFGPFTGSAWSPDGKRIAVRGKHNAVNLYDASTGKLLLSCRGHKDDIAALAFSPDGKLLASSGFDTTVKLWDTKTGKLLETQVTTPKGIIRINPQGHYRGSLDVEDQLRYVAWPEKGTVREYHPYEFGKRFGWKNNPDFSLRGE